MKVKDVMTATPLRCQLDSDLASTALLMWNGDCGAIPVVADDDRVVGIITDRDICMAAATQGRPIQEVLVAQVIQQGVHTCRPEDDVESAAALMNEHQVRRLPVVDAKGHLTGVLALNDLVSRARKAGARGTGVPADLVLRVCKGIGRPPGKGRKLRAAQ